MNNKGFAISTMLYGLSVVGLLLTLLMVQTMSASRSEQRKLAEAIREDLSDFSVLSEFFKYENYTNGKTSYKLPITGWYKIELWTSASVIDEGTSSSSANYISAETLDNAGNYSSQTLYLEEGTTLNIFLGTTTKRETKICNRAAECTCSETGDSHCIATSYYRFKGRGTFDDEHDQFISNKLSNKDIHYKEETAYYAYKINVNERGKARISLVSTLKGKKYTPIDNAVNTKSGTFYIIDAKFGRALSYGKIVVDGNGNIVASKQNETVEFATLTGDDTQKWKFNPQDHSLVNVRNNFSLRSQTPIGNRQYLMIKDFFSDREFERWTINDDDPENPATTDGQATNVVQMYGGNGSKLRTRTLSMVKNSTTYFLYHNRAKFPGVTYTDDEDGVYTNEEIGLFSDSSFPPPTNKYRSFKFYIINAY